MYKKIVEFINETRLQYENSIAVLKGYENQLEDWNLEKISEDKFSFFSFLRSNNINIISYEQYLYIRDFVLMQYQNVLIFNNNIYFNQYKANGWLNNQTLVYLADHFDEEKIDKNDARQDIEKYLEIYSNVKKIDNDFYVTYNQFLTDAKELVFNTYIKRISEDIYSYQDTINTFDIVDEIDYLRFIEYLSSEKPEALQIIYENIGVNEDVFKEKIELLRTIYPDTIIRLVHNPNSDSIEIIPETYEILNKYWGASSFRDIDIYDLNEVKNGRRKITQVSQGEIITKLIEQVELCMDNKNYRDMFVTAPTGAGKSAMFQIPAIYLAERYKLFTLVISPLIGLMKDQVQGLESREYSYARTINSDISPIIKQQIIDEIAEGKCHILYLSPESLMGKSDLVNIIGGRKLGLLVIDEAHIVTTWGKQFRPDYWYLGDHIAKLRKSQQKRENMQFILATFTATAIYGGLENMYQETLQSLNMFDPITYLGYVRRNDIDIVVDTKEAIKNRFEYENDKFEDLKNQIERAIILDQKTLIYFPTVALIERFYDYCKAYNLDSQVAKYHGRLSAVDKEENYQYYLAKNKLIMIATKAFGMGIDIDDIEMIIHFAPTGNVCDYLQEIGRAARKNKLRGEAYYNFMSNDFKHINRLHGLSTIKKYQLIEVIEKIHNLHEENIRKDSMRHIRSKRNSMLVDAESFSHIFETPFFDHDDGINKVKTALLLIQKDFERTMSFSPFYVKPIPLFETGYFMINNEIAIKLNKQFNDCCHVEDKIKRVYSVNLKKIWEGKYKNKFTFPQFKYMLYTNDEKLNFQYKLDMDPALNIQINYEENYKMIFDQMFELLKKILTENSRLGNYISIEEIAFKIQKSTKASIYSLTSMVEVVIASISTYKKEFNPNINGRIYKTKMLKNNSTKYSFESGISNYFRWLKGGFLNIQEELNEDTLFVIKTSAKDVFREKLTILGVLESMGVLNFKALGGSNSQLYIYINQTKTLKEIINNPDRYRNKLLDLVGDRHVLSVMMLSYLFDNDFSSNTCWDIIEDYFLGKIPEVVRKSFTKQVGYELPQGV